MESLGLGARLWLALTLPWRIIFDGLFAAKLTSIDAPAPTPLPAPRREPKVEVREAEIVRPAVDPGPALQLLAIFQREGRFVDFLREDVSSFSDADIGAAARVVHEGCSRALGKVVELAPVRSEGEGAAIELPVGFDPARVRVTGKVVGEPPFRGKLAHHGWLATAVHLPETTAGHDPKILAPAEVEL